MDEADRGRHTGFARHDGLAGGPGSLSFSFGTLGATMADVKLTANEAVSDLPAICMRCGEPAADTVKNVFKIVPMSPNSSPLGDKVTLNAPLCKSHLNYFRNRNWARIISFVVAAVPAGIFTWMALNAANANPFWAVVVTVALAWCALIVILEIASIRVGDVQGEMITFKGVSTAFIRELDSHRKR